jgi:peptidoglycan/LPS O-acetylase OafA/YrhL
VLFDTAGFMAVLVFVIISGFVITHLLLTRNEPYPAYITRRALRIYPVYLVCVGAALLTMPLHSATFTVNPWGAGSPAWQQMADEAASLAAHGYGPHLAAHLSLLHGVIPERMLGFAHYMFVGPAWSMSLEWQFYLVAPWILRCLGTLRSRALLMLAAVAAYVAWRFWGHSDFVSPSFLPAAGPYFALGIATRLIYPRLPTLTSYPFVTVLLACAFALNSQALLPCLVWVAFVAWMRLSDPADAPSAALDRMLQSTLDSRVARYLGERSYATYLVHQPILQTLTYLCAVRLALVQGSLFLAVLVLAPVLILAASAILHRLVERPAMELGRRLFVAQDSATPRWYKPRPALLGEPRVPGPS